jgi:hypothetical protein
MKSKHDGSPLEAPIMELPERLSQRGEGAHTDAGIGRKQAVRMGKSRHVERRRTIIR